MKGFLPEVIYDDPFMVMASKLAEGLKEKGLAHAKISIGGWAGEFRKLCANHDPAKVTQCIEWLCANLTNRYTPQVRSAASFRTKFNQIDAARQREMKLAKPRLEAAVEMLHLRMGLIWPSNTDATEVPYAMQRSRDRYSEFCRLLGAAKERHRSGMMAGLLFRVDATLHSSISAVEIWWRDVHKMACTWDRWNGNLSAWEWSRDHRWVTEMGQQHALAYCGNPDKWHELLGLVYEDK